MDRFWVLASFIIHKKRPREQPYFALCSSPVLSTTIPALTLPSHLNKPTLPPSHPKSPPSHPTIARHLSLPRSPPPFSLLPEA